MGVELVADLVLAAVLQRGRALTLVIEHTADPTTWMIVTGWSSTVTERKLLGGSS